jgi:flagellar P-ring protein precursor FlgI
MDAGTVQIKVPEGYLGRTVELVTVIEGLDVIPDSVAKVVLNERTGTVIIGKDVKISTIAIAHGNLSIEIKETPNVSQPLPFSEGETVVVPETETSIKEGNSGLFLVEPGVSIGEMVRALNALGVSPRDLITIFQTLKAAGALQAQLEII